MREQFDFEGLGKLDGGRLKVAFDRAVSQIHRDLQDRPGDTTARTVTLECSFKPHVDERGDLEAVDVAATIKKKTPPMRSRKYNMRATGDGFHFEELSPEDPDQLTLFDGEMKPKNYDALREKLAGDQEKE